MKADSSKLDPIFVSQQEARRLCGVGPTSWFTKIKPKVRVVDIAGLKLVDYQSLMELRESLELEQQEPESPEIDSDSPIGLADEALFAWAERQNTKLARAKGAGKTAGPARKGV